jgi:sec-independent protein translocase protein TatB
MFDFDVGKLLLIGVVALIFIPPKDLPAALRQIGRMVGKARRMAADFQNQFNEAIRDTELDNLKQEFRHLKEHASMTSAVEKVTEIVENATASAPSPLQDKPVMTEVAGNAQPVSTEAAPEARDAAAAPVLPETTPKTSEAPASATEIHS